MSTNIYEDVKYIRDKVDQLDNKLDSYQLNTEHRMTKVEQKASILGILSGVISAALASIVNKNG